MNKALVPLLIALTTLSAGAHASGFQVREQSADGMGRAFAGATAQANDLSTLFYNPAGMSWLEGNQAGVEIAWVAPHSQFSGSNMVGPQATIGSNGGNHSQGVAAGAAYLLWDAAPDWRVGLSLATPFGMRSDYDEDWVGRYHALDTRLANANFSPSVAYRVNDRLSVAAGLQVAYTDIILSNALNFGALVPGSGDGRLEVEANDWQLGWTASVLYQPTPSTRLGLAYRSAIHHRLKGEADFQGVPGALAGSNSFKDADVAADLTLPDTITLGIHHTLSPKWAVMSDISWTNWSVLRRLRLEFADNRPEQVQPLGWRDTWFASLGVTHTPNEKLRLNLGVAYDMSPMEDHNRIARLPDSDRFWLAGGLSYSPRPGHNISLSYAHLFADTARIDQADPNLIGGRLVGSYDNHVDVISVGYTIRF